MTDKELVQEEMRMAVRWAASSNYWSEKLREFFGPDARDGIVALEQQLRDAREELARLQQPEKTNQCAETCERAKLCAVCEVSLNQEQEPVAEVKPKMTGGNVGIATVIHEIYSPFRERLRPGDKLYLLRT